MAVLSYTSLYGLFALTSLALFNSLLLLARYARQIKVPPQDDEFDALLSDNKSLQSKVDASDGEMSDLKAKIGQLEQEIKKAEEALAAKATELDAAKKPAGA